MRKNQTGLSFLSASVLFLSAFAAYAECPHPQPGAPVPAGVREAFRAAEAVGDESADYHPACDLDSGKTSTDKPITDLNFKLRLKQVSPDLFKITQTRSIFGKTLSRHIADTQRTMVVQACQSARVDSSCTLLGKYPVDPKSGASDFQFNFSDVLKAAISKNFDPTQVVLVTTLVSDIDQRTLASSSTGIFDAPLGAQGVSMRLGNSRNASTGELELQSSIQPIDSRFEDYNPPSRAFDADILNPLLGKSARSTVRVSDALQLGTLYLQTPGNPAWKALRDQAIVDPSSSSYAALKTDFQNLQSLSPQVRMKVFLTVYKRQAQRAKDCLDRIIAKQQQQAEAAKQAQEAADAQKKIADAQEAQAKWADQQRNIQNAQAAGALIGLLAGATAQGVNQVLR